MFNQLTIYYVKIPDVTNDQENVIFEETKLITDKIYKIFNRITYQVYLSTSASKYQKINKNSFTDPTGIIYIIRYVSTTGFGPFQAKQIFKKLHSNSHRLYVILLPGIHQT